MLRTVTNSFTSYQLTEEQIIEGTKLRPENVYVIQNHVSALAEEKLNLIFDPLNPMSFALRNAELQGQIDILKMLLEASESTLSKLSTTE